MEASAVLSVTPLVSWLTARTEWWSSDGEQHSGGSEEWLLTKLYCCADMYLLVQAQLRPQMTFKNVACILHLYRVWVFLFHAALTNHGWQFTHVSWSIGLGKDGAFSLTLKATFFIITPLTLAHPPR